MNLKKGNEICASPVIITGKHFGEERALYGTRGAEIEKCTFAGEEDGESALKECRNIKVRNCMFSLRYPLWHCDGFALENCSLDEGVRASVWYSHNGVIRHCSIEGIKCLRECSEIDISDSKIKSKEFGWRCQNVTLRDTEAESEYFLFETKNINVKNLRMTGKYSFQYTENVTVEDSVLDTKDAFWHAKNVTVRNSVVKGEYLGWYSEGLTLINCKITGTQPLCYCRGLRLVDCTTEGCDLAFEYSDVEATVRGDIVSVKNPRSGRVCAGSIGQIILENSVIETDCEICTGYGKE